LLFSISKSQYNLVVYLYHHKLFEQLALTKRLFLSKPEHSLAMLLRF